MIPDSDTAAGSQEPRHRPPAFVLCGGLGKRLRPALADRPKAMAPVAGRPFLARLLDLLAGAGFERIVLCTGFMSESIESAFAGEYRGMAVEVSREQEPLGTAGALRLALERVADDEIVVLNGDSYCGIDPLRLATERRARRANAVIALVEVGNTGRYGRVELARDGSVVRFVEKGADRSSGWINAGIYCLGRSVIEDLPAGVAVSLEREVFPALIGRGLYGLPVEAAFVDIGTPEALERAQTFFGTPPAGAQR